MSGYGPFGQPMYDGSSTESGDRIRALEKKFDMLMKLLGVELPREPPRGPWTEQVAAVLRKVYDSEHARVAAEEAKKEKP